MSNYPAFIEHMVDEQTKLNTNIQSNIDFMRTEKYEQMCLTQIHMLEDQITVMKKYSEILFARIIFEKRLYDAT